MLRALHGGYRVDELETEAPWLRVDIELTAALAWGKAHPMPPKEHWARWVREVRERLESIEPLLPDETTRRNDVGRLEILGWQGTPEVEIEVTDDGEAKLGRVRLPAFQILRLPRVFDAPERSDDEPERQLQEMFGRIRKALHTWSECLDLLQPPSAQEARR